MRKLLLLLALIVCGPTWAATKYYCQCDAGAASGCTDGVDGNSGASMALARKTISQFKTDWQAGAAGDSFLFCQGGFWASAATGAMKNSNATKTNPVTVDSYDATSVWSGGSGIKPIWENTAVADMLNLTKGTLTHSEGYVFKNLELRGGGTNTLRGIVASNDTDYVTIDGFTISGVGNGIQCNGAGSSTATNDGISSHWTIKNSTFTSIGDNGILIGCDHTVIEKNVFTNVGDDILARDHSIYITGASAPAFPRTISTITGNGTTATLTTATPHGLASGSHFTITVSGTTSAGTGSFNATAAVGTVTGSSTITYAATGTPSASVVGAYTASYEVVMNDFVVRNNTMTENNLGAAGNCKQAALVVHGAITGILIENNVISETVAPTSAACVGIEIDDGSYPAPEDYSRFRNVVIRNNTTINMALGIGLDETVQGLIENNYHYSTYSQNSVAGGIRMRSKNGTPSSPGGANQLPANAQNPHNITIRYNTAYLTAPNTGHWGIALNGNVGDALTGTMHNLYGNVVVLGSSAATSTQCFNTENMTLAMFNVKDYNACYYLSASVPKWENSSSLATIQGAADANKSDLHSLMASTADVTTGQPFLLSPTTGPNIGTSSALKNAGHPSLGPRTAWGGAVRNQGAKDIGAFEFGATLGVVPGAPTRPSAP